MSRLESDLFDPAPDPDLLCAICQCVLSNPTEASNCRHVFCHECIMTWLNSGARTCPTCRSVMTSYDVRRALPALCNVIGRLMMQCVNRAAGCSTRLTVEQLETHLRTECQAVTERCECGTEFLRRDLNAHKDVCAYCLYPCSKCDLMVTARERNTHNCFLALQQVISGQKYLLKELRSHLAQVTSLTLSQQLEKQLSSFDSRTRNYSSSLATEFLPPTTPNCPTSDAATNVASAGHLSPDFLVDFSPSVSRTANSRNQHLPVADARHSEENTLQAGFDSPQSPRHNSAAGTYQYGASTPSYYSENESEATVSHVADNDDTAQHFSDVDDDEEFDADSADERNVSDSGEDEIDELFSDSSIDEEYQSHSYDEYDDGGEHAAIPRETYTDSDNESHDNRHLDLSPQHRPSAGECHAETNVHVNDVQHMPSVNEDNEDIEGDDDDDDDDGCGDDVHQSPCQQQDGTGGSHTLRGEPEHGRNVEEEEQERLNSQSSEGRGVSAADAVQALPVDAVVDDNIPNHRQDMSDYVNRSLSSIDSDDHSSTVASPSPHHAADDNTDEDDEVFSPSFSLSYSHDDDDNESCDEDAPMRSQRRRRSLRSRSHVGQPVSPRNRHSWTDSRASYTSSDSVDSADDSDDSRTAAADRRGMKRRHSDTSDTASDDTDRPATNGHRRSHKQHRLR